MTNKANDFEMANAGRIFFPTKTRGGRKAAEQGEPQIRIWTLQECDLMSFLAAAALNQINPKRERERRRKWMERSGEIFWAGRDGQSKNPPPNIFAINLFRTRPLVCGE